MKIILCRRLILDDGTVRPLAVVKIDGDEVTVEDFVVETPNTLYIEQPVSLSEICKAD